MATRVLGISAYYHDSAAALVEGGRIVAAAQEERFTRVRHDAAFPARSIRFCLDRAGIRLSQVDRIAFYDKPFAKFDRLLETYLAFAPRGFGTFRRSFPLWVKEKLFQKRLLAGELAALEPGLSRARVMEKLLFSEHHLAHAASAYFPSPFAEAAVLTVDGVGEWATTAIGRGEGRKLELSREIRFPHSLGLLYSAFTYYTGFKVNSGEYKLMGLAPYGTPRFRDLILEKLIDLREDGSYRLDQRYFDYCTGLKMTGPRFDELFGGPPRKPDQPITQREKDLAASVQAVTEEAMLRLARFARKETGSRNLCLAGGVALNCVANGRLEREKIFDRLWIQPAAGDAGGAIGSAFAGYHGYLGEEREAAAIARLRGGDAMNGALLGPEFSDAEIERRLTQVGARWKRCDGDGPGDAELIGEAVSALERGQAVGWFQGPMEFGPRALGARSILADPRVPEMQKTLNLKIKFRESFRPFAPVVPRERLSEWFALDTDSPYMMLVAPVASPPPAGVRLPAVTHVDGSARVQSVSPETHPRFHRLLTAFGERTGCPVLVNTSYNVRGEPIVCTPEEAFRCFMGTDIDALAIGRCWLTKAEQDPALRNDYAGFVPAD